MSILNKLALIAAITLEIDTIGNSDQHACQRADYRNAGIWYVSPTMQRVDAVCNGATEEEVLGAKDFLLSLKLCVECQVF